MTNSLTVKKYNYKWSDINKFCLSKKTVNINQKQSEN